MRNRVSAVALWVAATVLATTAVWLGTGAIGDAARSDTDLVVAATSTTSPVVPGASTTTTPLDTTAPAATTPTSATVAPPPPTRPTPTAVPATTQPPAPIPTRIVPTLPVLGETRTYVLTGGTVTVRFSPDAVTVVLATPNPGFGVDAEQRGAVAIRVEFESDQHRSRLDASWIGGPVDEVREDG